MFKVGDVSLQISAANYLKYKRQHLSCLSTVMFGGTLFIQCIQMSNKQAKILNNQQSVH